MAAGEVVPLDWRIIAAAVAAVGVLASGTLLATQVETDLNAQLASPIKETPFDPPGRTPLKLNDLKLPKELPLELPAGTQISPDLSKMTLPKDLDLSLPEDLDLSKLDLTLPQDLDLQLPPGTFFDPRSNQLKFPQGGSIKLPDRSFEFPPGSGLDIPPELTRMLQEQGLPPGVVDKARQLGIQGLPPDLHALLDPPSFDGPGTMRLPAGTTMTLPDGQLLPFAAGALASAAPYVLPPGTKLDLPFDASSASGAFPVPRPAAPQNGGPGSAPAASPMDTEITLMPARVRKGEPVVVSGYVRDRATGSPIAGAPVDVFMNDTKETPGVLVGQGTSDASGTFKIELRLPEDKPARQYQLVNHAVAFVDASGVAHGDGWGDPPFATTAATKLSLVLPSREGLGATTSIHGLLIDHTGVGAPGVTIVVTSGGATLGRVVTGSDGAYALTHQFGAGSHVVEARSVATPYYEQSPSVRSNITINGYGIEVAPTVRANVGVSLLLTGRALDQGMPATGVLVTLDPVFGGPSQSVRANAQGEFSFRVAASESPGTYTLTYRLPEQNVLKLQRIDLLQYGKLVLDAPRTGDIEMPVEVKTTLLANGTPLPEHVIRVVLAGPGGTREFSVPTDAAGVAAFRISPLRATPGTYTLRASVPDRPNLFVTEPESTLTLGRFEVDWSAPKTILRGETLHVNATLRFNGKPFAHETLTLEGFRAQPVTTGADGTFQWTGQVPTVTSLGAHKLSLTAKDHPRRETTVEVIAVPQITLDTPPSLHDGIPFDAAVRLTDDQGDPIRNSDVTITAVAGNSVTRNVVKTDAGGRWRGPLNVSAPQGSSVTLSARVEPTGPYMAADTAQVMSVTAPTSTPTLPWLIPLGVVAVLAAGGGAYAFLRKKRAAPIAAAAVAIAPVVAAQSDIDLRFDIPQGEPTVWGVGDPIDLVATNQGPAGRFDLTWSGGSSVVALSEGAHARTTLTFTKEGEVALRAQRTGGHFAQTEARVRIVDYRKETAREFDLFLEQARRIDPALTRRSTPREITGTLASRLGEASQEELDELALVMEITNYSHYAVSRAHYLRFVRAARALDEGLGGAPSRVEG